jgi:hypothetical protein
MVLREQLRKQHENSLPVVVVIFLILLILWQLQRSLPYAGNLADFGSFIASGRAAGMGMNPYGIYPPLTFHVELPVFSGWNPNLNPPTSLPLFELLGKLDPSRAFRLWWSFSFLSYIAMVGLLARHYWLQQPWLPALCAFAAAGFWDTLMLGQIYVPLACVAGLAWILLEKDRTILAGILIGFVVANKPNFLVWPCVLFFSYQFRSAIAAFLSAGVFTVLPFFRYGPQVYWQWLEVTTQHPGSHLDFISNASLPGLIQRMGMSNVVGFFISGLLLLVLAVWAWRWKPSPLHASGLGLLGGILASPLGWVHYTLFLLPVFFFHRTTPLLSIIIFFLIIPLSKIMDVFMVAPTWQQSTFGSIYNWALILLLIYFWKMPVKNNVLSDSSSTQGLLQPQV